MESRSRAWRAVCYRAGKKEIVSFDIGQDLCVYQGRMAHKMLEHVQRQYPASSESKRRDAIGYHQTQIQDSLRKIKKLP